MNNFWEKKVLIFFIVMMKHFGESFVIKKYIPIQKIVIKK